MHGEVWASAVNNNSLLGLIWSEELEVKQEYYSNKSQFKNNTINWLQQ